MIISPPGCLVRLRETVDSDEKETRPSVERAIQRGIVDGTSTDGTVEYFQDNSFSNVTFRSSTNQSLFDAVVGDPVIAARNTLIILGTGAP